MSSGNQITNNTYLSIRNSMKVLISDFEIEADLTNSTVSVSQGENENKELSKNKHAVFLTSLQGYNVFGTKSSKSNVIMDNVKLKNVNGTSHLIATKNIEKDSIITIIPVDMLAFSKEKDCSLYYSDFLQKQIFESDKAREEHFKEMIAKTAFTIGEGKQIFSSILNKSNPAFLGHFALDGANNFQDKRKYLVSSLEARNSMIKLENNHDSPFLPLVATKNITKGDEIFISKGVVYWFGKKTDLGEVKYVVLENEKSDPVCESFQNNEQVQIFKESKCEKCFASIVNAKDVISSLFLLSDGIPPKSAKYIYTNNHLHPGKTKFSPVYGSRSPDVNDDVYITFLSRLCQDFNIEFYADDEESINIYIKAGFLKTSIS